MQDRQDMAQSSTLNSILSQEDDSLQESDAVSIWLNHATRCFGDKGDVEDITEGPFTNKMQTCDTQETNHLPCRQPI